MQFLEIGQMLSKFMAVNAGDIDPRQTFVVTIDFPSMRSLSAFEQTLRRETASFAYLPLKGWPNHEMLLAGIKYKLTCPELRQQEAIKDYLLD